jgi:hypothetical protein
MPIPISVQSQKSNPLGTLPPPEMSFDAPALIDRSSIIQRLIGRNAIAASAPETMRPW